MLNLHDAIIDAWDSYLIGSRVTEESSKPKKFYVSDMGKCLRMRYLKRKGIKGEYGADTYYTFAHGDFIHKMGYKALEAKNMLLSTEQYVETDQFRGRYDGKLLHEGKSIMFDFKSTNPYVMKRLVAGGADNIENILQVLMYVHLDRVENKNLSDTAAVVYVNKLPSDKIEPTIIKPREYHYQTYKDELLEDIKKISDYWLSNTIPPCTCPAWSTQRYNSFWLFCRMEEEEIKKHLAFIDAGNTITSDGFDITIKKQLVRKEEE